MPRRFRPFTRPRAHKLPTPSVLVTTLISTLFLLTLFRYAATPQSLLPFVHLTFYPRTSRPPSPFIPDANSITPTQCILYDRPPRTASTTIGTALYSCLRRHGYTQPPAPPTEQRPLLVSHMLALRGHRKALLSRHLYLNATSVNLLRDNCHLILYISSCAPINRRIWSAVKYSIAGGHGNASLSEPQMRKAFKRARTSDRQLSFLNAYPYVDKRKRPIHVYDALLPDYVIRIDKLHHDLANLLAAFGCNTTYVSANVHHASATEQKLLSQLQVGNDTIYERLVQIAEEKNQIGLLKAAVFVNQT